LAAGLARRIHGILVPSAHARVAGTLVGNDIGAGTGLFNLSRQLGGSVGIAFLSTYLDHRTTLHRAALVNHINPFNPVFVYRLQCIQHGLMLKGFTAVVAQKKAYAIIDGIVQSQPS